ncbi:tRNA uridine 5-oxyacetic acid(34) methyltransferase CmoM [Aurantivibrio infirmus]
MNDRNFDDLVYRFEKNVYSGLKGEIRLRILQRDLEEFVPEIFKEEPLNILDAGGGGGQVACYLASRGHRVILCDISAAMLEKSRQLIAEKNLTSLVETKHQSIQSYCEESRDAFDVITCHAVLEWTEQPQEILTALLGRLKTGGAMSLSYYNIHGLVFKNLLRTNYKKLRNKTWAGRKGSLTPPSPLDPVVVNKWLSALPVENVCESGIRVFQDYVFDVENRSRDSESLIEMELEYSRLEPYKYLGRYIHVLSRKVG